MASDDRFTRTTWGADNAPPGSPPWVHVVLDKFDSEEPVSEDYFQHVLAQVRSLSPVSLQRVGDVLDRKRPLDELDDAEQDLFYVVCDFLPHPDKLAYYEAMRREHEALRRQSGGGAEALKDAEPGDRHD